MIEQNHNFEIETALLHFKSAFDDTVINRYSHEDSSSVGIKGNVQQKIKVNYVFGPKQRILADLEGKTDTVKFPIVAICPTGMGRDDQRVKNKNDNLRFRLPDGSYGNYQIVPWNINVSMSIMAKFQEDVTQIISNFAVMSNPYIIFSWREPKTGREVNAEVFWDGQVAMEYPGANADLPPNTPFRVMATANFVIKTYLYRTAIENTANICKINTDIVTTKNFYCDYESLVSETADNDRDSYEILGKPQLRYVNDWYFRTGQTPEIIVQGDGFALTDAVFVSGSNPDMYTLSSYEYYGNKFKGQMVPEFEIIDAQTLKFTIPSSSALGLTDLIVVNECGMGQLTVDADRCSRVENPYKTSQIEYYEWQVLQFPYLNGLIISNELNGGYVIDYNQDIVYYTECYDDGTTIDIPLSALLESDTRTVSCQPKITVQRIASPDYDHQTLSYDEESYTLTISGGNSISLSALNSVVVAETDPLFTAWLQTSATSLLTVEEANNLFVSLTGGVINGGLSATSLSADTLYVRDNTIYFIDGSDNIVETLNSDDVAAFKAVNTTLNGNSADWNDISSTVQTNSSVWDSSYITVQTNSAVNWNYQGTDIKSLTSEWESVYNTVNSNSSVNWDYQGTDIKALTSNWESTYINFNSQSANNISVYSTVESNSATWATGTGGGGGGVLYYFNQSNLAQSPTTNIPITAHQLGRLGLSAQTIYTSPHISQAQYDLVAGFLTDVLDPSTDVIPGGLWDFNIWGYANATDNNPVVLQALVYTYDGVNAPVLLSTSDDSVLANNGQFTQRIISCLVPQRPIPLSTRIYVEFRAKATSNNKTVTLAFGDSTPSHIHTSLPMVGGTGLVKVVNGNMITPASLLVNADVASDANIDQSKISGLTDIASSANSVYSTVNSNSANWDYQGTDVKLLTGDWESVYNTVNDNSATTWNYQGTDIKTLTSNWDSSSTTVQTNSANWDYQGTDIKPLTSNWENTYTTVRTNSSYWKSAFNQFSIVDNFIGAIQCNSRAGGSGSGVGVGSGSHLSRPAVWLTTGTTTTGNAQLIERASGSLQAWIKGAASLFMQWAMVPSALSDATDTYTIRAGLEQNNLGSTNDGIFFRYTHSVNSGNWQAVTRASSIETVTNTAIVNTTASYTKFKIEIDSTGTSVIFSINNAVVATHTTNIPAQAGYLLGLIKSAGTNSRVLYVSPFEYIQTLNTPY